MKLDAYHVGKTDALVFFGGWSFFLGLLFVFAVYRIPDWVVYAFGFWVFLSMIVEILRWAAVYRVYGGIPTSLMRQMITYTTKNRFGKMNLWFACILILISALYVARSVALHVPAQVDHGVAVASIVLILLIGMVLNLALPPGVLLLGTSHPVVILTKLALNKVKGPYRVASLLRPGEEVPMRYLAKFSTGDLRTTNSYEWRMVAHHLMDVVPAIIFDDISLSPLSMAELDRLRKRDLTYKVVFTREAVRDMFSEQTPDTKLAEELSQSFVEGIASDAERHQKFRRYGRGYDAYGRYVKLHKDLAVLLMDRVRPLLSKPTDLSRRRAAQLEYSEMTRAIPSSNRFSAKPEAMTIRYRSALQWHLRHFCEVCKGVAVEEAAECLLEDIPAVVSAEAERRFLQRSRGLDESESIAISFLEMAQEEPYKIYSIKGYGLRRLRSHEGHLMVGQVARYRQDWDASLDHLRRALDGFSQDRDREYNRGLSNIALTHFLLGEVHMALYRAAGLADQRANAMNHFQRSIEIDSGLGSKGRSAKSRLQALALA